MIDRARDEFPQIESVGEAGFLQQGFGFIRIEIILGDLIGKPEIAGPDDRNSIAGDGQAVGLPELPAVDGMRARRTRISSSGFLIMLK